MCSRCLSLVIEAMDGPVVSIRDCKLSATLLSRRELLYSEGADAAFDHPAHVRAGSSLAWFGKRIAVIQDDANFVALIDPDTGLIDAWPLPPGVGGLRQFDDLRGNKRYKLDLEACFSVRVDGGEILVAMGSGSSEHRETVAIIDTAGQVKLIQANGLYSRLRSEKAFSGSELNVEGALYIDGKLRLFNRGNGAWRGGVPPLNATCDIPWPEFEAYLRGPASQPVPTIRHIVQYDLGDLRCVNAKHRCHPMGNLDMSLEPRLWPFTPQPQVDPARHPVAAR